VVLASLLVPAAALGATRLPTAELPAATTRTSDCQGNGESAVADAVRRSNTTRNDAVHRSNTTRNDAVHRSNTTCNDAVATLDNACDRAVTPTGREAIDNATNAAHLPGTACRAAAKSAKANEQAGEATLATEPAVRLYLNLRSSLMRS
jgi:hypothetical protein